MQMPLRTKGKRRFEYHMGWTPAKYFHICHVITHIITHIITIDDKGSFSEVKIIKEPENGRARI